MTSVALLKDDRILPQLYDKKASLCAQQALIV